MTDTKLRLIWAALPEFGDRCDDFVRALPAEEQKRADRFRVESARGTYILARTIVRHELSELVGVGPSQLGIGLADRGKPFLVRSEIETTPHFNLSHSGDLVVVVIAEVEVGADVECLRPVPDARRLARRFFSKAEQRTVESVSGEARDRAFLRIWTQKEAYLKATGMGVGMKLREVETEPDPDARPGLIAIAGDRREASRWKLHNVELPNAVCTVAAPPSTTQPSVRRITPADLELS